MFYPWTWIRLFVLGSLLVNAASEAGEPRPSTARIATSASCIIDLTNDTHNCGGIAALRFLQVPTGGQTALAVSLDPGTSGFTQVHFDVTYNAQPSGFTVDIGDSVTNNGGAGDAGTQSNDAELQVLNQQFSLFGNDDSTPSRVLQVIDGFAASGATVSFTVRNDHVDWSDAAGTTGALDSPFLYALDGQPDGEGPVNYDVFAAFNRVIDGNYRSGTGASYVVITLEGSDTPPGVSAGGPYTVNEGAPTAVIASGAGAGATYAWDLDNDGTFEAAGRSVTFSAAALDGPGVYPIALQATGSDGQTVTAQSTVTVVNVAPAATFIAPFSVTSGSSIDLSLTAPVDVPADLPTLEYAFDCGNGYGSWSAAATVRCPAAGGRALVVRGQVRDKDGGASEYVQTVTVDEPTVSPDPFSVPPHNDSTFVVDRAADLDTGCSSLGDRSLTFQIPVDRVVGSTAKLLANGWLAPTSVLKIAAYDIDSAGGNGINPERDRVYFNGLLVPAELLTGDPDSWKVNTLVIPTSWVAFPIDPGDGNAPTPAINTVRIDIDTGNTETPSCTSIDWASLSIAAPRPVLLVHGFNSSGAVWNDLWTNPDPAHPKRLDLLGLPAATVDLGGFASIVDNSFRIQQRVEGLARRWGVDQINIVAHSKGGLDSRQYIEGTNRISTLAQIATPNRGTPIATYGRIVLDLLGRLGVVIDLAAPAIRDLSVENMTLYNLFHGHNPRTRYVSLAGEYRFTGLLSFIPNNLLTAVYFGANDLVVPAWSVHGLSYAQQLTYKSRGSNHQAIHTGLPHSGDAYDLVIPYLKVQSAPLPLSSDAAFLALAQETTEGGDEITPEAKAIRTIVGTIAQGEIRTQTLYVEGTQPIGFMLYHGTGELDLTLISPSGRRIDTAVAASDPGVDFEPVLEGDGLRMKMYALDHPEAGTWTLEVSAPTVVNPSGTEPYGVIGVVVESPIELEGSTDRSAYHLGDPILVHASLKNAGGPIKGASVTAQIHLPDQSLTSLTLVDDGTGDDAIAHDGIYSGRFAPTAQPGEYDLVVSAAGPAAAPCNREKLLVATVSASTSRLDGSYADFGDDSNFDGLFDDLVVEVGMDVTLPGSYRMLGELSDSSGALIATATAVTDLSAGGQAITLRFDGSSVYKHGADGPYQLSLVRVAEEQGSTLLPLDERLPAYTTAGYDHREFQHPALDALDQAVTTPEDTPVEITLGAESDIPGPLGFTVVTTPTHGRLSGTAPHLTYSPDADFNGGDAFTWSVENAAGASALATVVVKVEPVNDPPALAGIASQAQDEGTVLRVALSASDPDGDDLKLAVAGLPAFATFTDNGDDTGVIVFAPGVNAAGTYPLTVSASDGSRSAATAFTLTVRSANRPPVVQAGPAQTANEGTTATFNLGSFTDAATDQPWTVDVAWGDGSSATSFSAVSPGALAAQGHAYADNGVYAVAVTVRDRLGAAQTQSFPVTVANVAPLVGAIQVPPAPAAVNTAVAVSAVFGDPGLLDTHTAVWDWNDGTTSAGTVGAKAVSGSHVYRAAGVYAVKLRVTDKDGGVGTVLSRSIVIYDPNGGLVIGAGWFSSPAGAYSANPALAGRATFAFLSRYRAGASVPSGETLFQFPPAHLTFLANTEEWLVVAGARAQYSAVGKLNGAGSFGLLITAIDGQVGGGGGVDRLRVKIWDRANGRIVYDNQLGAADGANPTTGLQGGTLVIQPRPGDGDDRSFQ